jgi:Icc protein
MQKNLSVIQFTDTHLYADSASRMRGVDTYDTFKQTVAHALANEGVPDFILLTGDISMDESSQSYERVREIIESINVPIYFLPGNHDCFETMKWVFKKGSQSNIRHDRSFSAGNWRIVLLDSVLPQRVEGRLSDEELARLDEELSSHADLNALVCLHHNAIPIAKVPEDDKGLENAGAFFRLLDKHANVRGVLWGHVHGDYNLSREGVPLYASPSTCIQFKVEDQGVSIAPLPPGYRVLSLTANGSIATRVRWLENLPAGLEVG